MPTPNVSLAGSSEDEVINYVKSNTETLDPEDATEAIYTESELAEIKNTLQTEFSDTSRYLPGIYGYIVDAETGDRITLSLSPYEIAPRLSDPDLYPKGNFSKGLTTAKAVGNRLSTAVVYTNFMQEVLPAPGSDPTLSTDARFGSKEDRIGMLSRFLTQDGEESSKSTFLHIVPDVEATGGKVEIQYKRFDKEGNPIEKLGSAYVPVNFNFVSSKYTLTIKEFIVENVSEANSEIYSLNKTFDGFTLRMFGQQPKTVSFSGVLTNFDDDVIGVDDHVRSQLGLIGSGSQRDVFLSYYKNFLAGTKCRDYSMKVYFYYNHKIVEGFLLDMSTSTNSQNDNFVSFRGTMIVRREYTTFEAGVGLGARNKLLRDYERSTGDLDIAGSGVFDSEISYRSNYRLFAIDQAEKNFGQIIAENKRYKTIREGVTFYEQQTYKWFDDKAQFDKTNSADMAELKVFCANIIEGIYKIPHITLIGDLNVARPKCVDKLVDYFIANNKSGFNRVMEYCLNQNSGKNWNVNPVDNDIQPGLILDYLYSVYDATANVLAKQDKAIMLTNDINMVFAAAHSSYFKEKADKIKK